MPRHRSDPLGIVAMGVELSVITPPVVNLYAVSGIAKIPIQTVLGAMIFHIRPNRNWISCTVS